MDPFHKRLKRIQGEPLEEDVDYTLPTLEWDVPIEPDEDYLKLLEDLETKGIPIPKRMYAQAAGMSLGL